MKALTPHIFHGALIASLGILPLWSGGWGTLSASAALGLSLTIFFGVAVAIALNEYLVKVSDLDWEYLDGRWKIALPIAIVLAGANLMAGEELPRRIAMGIGFGLIGLTALRSQSQTDVLLRVGVLLALIGAFWGLAGIRFFWCVPVILLLALQMSYDPPESRAYLSWRDHGQLALIIVGLAAGLVSVFVIIGFLLHLIGIDLNPSEPPYQAMQRTAEPRSLQIRWWDFVILAAAAYFLLPYLTRFFSKQEDSAEPDFQSGDHPAHRIAEQFKRALGRQSPREQVIYSYHAMLKALIKLGYVHDIATTPADIARQLQTQRNVPDELCQPVSDLFYRACYTAQTITAQDAAQMESLTKRLVEAYRET